MPDGWPSHALGWEPGLGAKGASLQRLQGDSGSILTVKLVRALKIFTVPVPRTIGPAITRQVGDKKIRTAKFMTIFTIR